MSKKIVSKSLLLKPKSFLKISGELNQKEYDLSFDSRKIEEGQSFFALKGENFNGINFLPEVLKKKCPLVIYEEGPDVSDLISKNPQTTFISTKDSIRYLQELSHLHMLNWKNEGRDKIVIGITGSNGKTTTKEMLVHFLNAAFPSQLIYTKGNLNNHIGVPFTLLSASKDHKILIVEVGTNHPGELQVLCDLVKPDAGIITSIGPSHLEFFKTVDNVFLEKRILSDSVLKNTGGSGHFILNKDDPYLAKIKSYPGLKTFGKTSGDFKITHMDQAVSINLGKEIIILKNNFILGVHNFENLCASFLLAISIYPEQKENFVKAASTFKPSNNRSTWIEKGNRKFFLDAYNANPGSMKASLAAFVEYLKKSKIPFSECFFVLGDMNELGENAPSLHQEIGALLKELQLPNVVFLGRYGQYYNKGFGGKENVFETKNAFEKKWSQISKNFKIFYIKGSRSLQLESILDIN